MRKIREILRLKDQGLSARQIAVSAGLARSTIAKRLGLSNVAFVKGDWYEPLAGLRFDALVSNPPCVDATDPHLDDPALRHEPRHALVAGATRLATDTRSLAECDKIPVTGPGCDI
ncbi:MAG: hypothetical protein PF501_04160 [Salinisphaera sp.]|jgi:release factor glutamine methyltransferase|nr:hypothetical protein [Salinisphaera sp.]